MSDIYTSNNYQPISSLKDYYPTNAKDLLNDHATDMGAKTRALFEEKMKELIAFVLANGASGNGYSEKLQEIQQSFIDLFVGTYSGQDRAQIAKDLTGFLDTLAKAYAQHRDDLLNVLENEGASGPNIPSYTKQTKQDWVSLLKSFGFTTEDANVVSQQLWDQEWKELTDPLNQLKNAGILFACSSNQMVGMYRAYFAQYEQYLKEYREASTPEEKERFGNLLKQTQSTLQQMMAEFEDPNNPNNPLKSIINAHKDLIQKYCFEFFHKDITQVDFKELVQFIFSTIGIAPPPSLPF